MDSEAKAPRSVTVVVGLAMIGVLAVAVLRVPRRAHSDTAAAAPAAPPAYSGPSPADRLASAVAELEALPPVQSPPLDKLKEALEGASNGDKGFRLPDGREPPPLPADAPRAIRIGVVLVRYQGAQLAPPNAPPREQALARAKALATTAKSDFAAAVKAGDPGSDLDLGRIERGILEPATQWVAFTLPVAGVSDVLDTPRGYWIVRRNK